MVFYLLKRIPSNIMSYQNAAILVKDNWDDWFTYETQSFMYYVDFNGSLHEIGAIKIGQKNMKKVKEAYRYQIYLILYRLIAFLWAKATSTMKTSIISEMFCVKKY